MENINDVQDISKHPPNMQSPDTAAVSATAELRDAQQKINLTFVCI